MTERLQNLTAAGVKDALEFYRQMWADGLIPPGAQADTGTEFAMRSPPARSAWRARVRLRSTT